MDGLLTALRNLGPMRLAVMGGVVMVMVGFFIYITSRLAMPDMELLYAQLNTKDAARVTQILGAQGIPYEISQGGTTVSVAGEDVARARLMLADQGIPGGGSMGYEIFDNTDSMGTTNFMQNVNLIRALEGELSKTIQSINIVTSARVHLVLPRRELFSRERQEPSASVVLRMSDRNRLEKGQVMAIQHLIATAVPSLLPSRVSIVDDQGQLLAAGFEDENDVGVIADKTAERQRKFENRMARTIEQLLEKTVGFGRVRAEVSAELDFDRISTEEEEFDPDGQVVRSTQTIELSANAQDSEGAPPVSVGTNLPDPNLQTVEGVSSSTSENRTEETVNFEISRKKTHHVHEIGEVRRLSVAVLVDGHRTTNEETGQLEYEPRNDADMELLASLVRGAIGFDTSRGDTIDIINMKFADFIPEEPKIQLFFGMNKNDLLKIVEIAVLGIVALLVILLVIRPLISRAFEAIPSAASLTADRMLADQTDAGADMAMIEEGMPEGDQIEELIDIERVEGRVKASSVKKVGEIVDKHPEEALSIIRNWMYQET